MKTCITINGWEPSLEDAWANGIVRAIQIYSMKQDETTSLLMTFSQEDDPKTISLDDFATSLGLKFHFIIDKEISKGKGGYTPIVLKKQQVKPDLSKIYFGDAAMYPPSYIDVKIYHE